jgi:hypothetical protein
LSWNELYLGSNSVEGSRLTEVAKLIYFDEHGIYNDNRERMLNEAGIPAEDRMQWIATIRNRVNTTNSDISRNFLVPLAYAIYKHYDKNGINLVKLDAGEQLNYLRDFVTRAPLYLNKRMWKDVQSLVDFDAIFSEYDNIDDETATIVGQWRQILGVKMVFGLRYALESLLAANHDKHPRAHFEKFKRLVTFEHFIKYKPALATIPIKVGGKSLTKSRYKRDALELQNWATPANLNSLKRKREVEH